MQELRIYSEAKRVLAEYKTVDEVKDFRDKALAIEAYAKQANDYELERDAAIARVRAERKCGELLAQTDKAKGNQHVNSAKSNNTTEQKTLSEMGITKDQSSKWQQLAAVPEKEFEDAINLPGTRPSTNHILKKHEPITPQPRMNGNALWWWGRLMDMERDNRFSTSIAELLDQMTDAMRADTERLLPKLRDYLNE